MYLVTAATDFEMQPFLAACRDRVAAHLVTGIGPVETAVRLYGWLSKNNGTVRGVINFGIAGAYVQPDDTDAPRLLDICLAEQEFFGDLGICLEDRIEQFDNKELQVEDSFVLDKDLLTRAGRILHANQMSFYTGAFVTVNCASGTAKRGKMLADRYRALCENMEGAAVARVCGEFDLPCLELRCVSNLVEDRDTTRWQLKKACRRAGEVTALVTEHLVGQADS